MMAEVKVAVGTKTEHNNLSVQRIFIFMGGGYCPKEAENV